MAKRWTSNDDERLKSEWDSGRSVELIAEVLTVAFDRPISWKSVFMRAKRIGLVSREWGKGRRFIEEHAADNDGPCLIWPFGRNSMGYGDTGDGLASRQMCVLANGEPPTPRHEAAHSCGNGHLGCVHPKHLRWATHAENMADRVRHGTENRGERHGNNKLTSDEVRLIRSLAGTATYPEIAGRFGVAATTVSSIINRHKWAWLE